MDKLKIGFNVLPLQSGHKFRGFGYYTKNLLENLKKEKDLEIKEFTNLNEVSGVDLIHYPFFDLFQKTLPLRKKFPTVVTVGDVTPIIFNKQYPSGIKGGIRSGLQKLALKRAGAVITISETSKNDIEKYLKIPKNKIFSIYLAVSENFKKITDYKKLTSVKVKYNLPERFALFVGNVNWNKNLINMAKGCILSGIDLYLVGKSFEQKDNLGHAELKSYREFLKEFRDNPKIHVVGFVEDNEIVEFYNLASVLLLPSFYEGFGLPILEAQACGIPVITSNVSSMPEVAGKGAILVDPNSVEEISGALKRIETMSDQLRKVGFENVKRFSWEETAKETIEVYQHLAAK